MERSIKIKTQSTTETSVNAAKIAVAAAFSVIFLVALLHIVSPEFDPSWRMVSEYALGNYGWILSLMFVIWAVSSWALYFSIRSQVKTKAGKTGLIFLVAAGMGMSLAAIFDVRHFMHSVASLGMPLFATGAMLITYSLIRNQGWKDSRKKLVLTANLTWISLILMAITIFILISGFQKAGITNAADLTSLPDDMIAISGWANRLLFIAFCAWTITVAKTDLRLRK